VVENLRTCQSFNYFICNSFSKTQGFLWCCWA
jgi:hypothetical protein